MLDSKFLFTLVGLVVAVMAICNLNNTAKSHEGWNNSGFSRTVKVMREVIPTGKSNNMNGAYSLQNNYQSILGEQKFFQTPSFQSNLSPRFGNVDYGANIKYNMPAYKNQAVPCVPTTFGKMATEGYKQNTRENYNPTCGAGGCGGGCGVPSCGKGGTGSSMNKGNASYAGKEGSKIPEGPSASSNYQNALNQDYSTMNPGSDLVAVNDMTTLNSLGDSSQPIVYDRYIYASQKSKLNALGCPIRGDLPIVPSNTGWFSPSVTPNIDLRQGAMSIIGGAGNDTASSLGQLAFVASGGVQNVSAGMNMSNQYQQQLGQGMSSINVQSFA
jgi:hypothetical protein